MLIYAYFLVHGKSLSLEFRHAGVVDALATSASVINQPRKTTQGRKADFPLGLSGREAKAAVHRAFILSKQRLMNTSAQFILSIL